jgi:hypothetical protein
VEGYRAKEGVWFTRNNHLSKAIDRRSWLPASRTHQAHWVNRWLNSDAYQWELSEMTQLVCKLSRECVAVVASGSYKNLTEVREWGVTRDVAAVRLLVLRRVWPADGSQVRSWKSQTNTPVPRFFLPTRMSCRWWRYVVKMLLANTHTPSLTHTRPDATSVWVLKLLVYETFTYADVC